MGQSRVRPSGRGRPPPASHNNNNKKVQLSPDPTAWTMAPSVAGPKRALAAFLARVFLALRLLFAVFSACGDLASSGESASADAGHLLFDALLRRRAAASGSRMENGSGGHAGVRRTASASGRRKGSPLRGSGSEAATSDGAGSCSNRAHARSGLTSDGARTSDDDARRMDQTSDDAGVGSDDADLAVALPDDRG